MIKLLFLTRLLCVTAPRLSAAGGAGGALVGKVSAVAKHAEKKPAPVFAITEDVRLACLYVTGCGNNIFARAAHC